MYFCMYKSARGFSLQDVFLYVQKRILPNKLERIKLATRFIMGRKKAKINRTEKLIFRCSEAEINKIKELSVESGLDMSKFIRGKAFPKEPPAITAVEFLELYKEKTDELKKIGEKINQVARYANYSEKTGQFNPALMEELNKYLQDFIRCQRETADLIRKILKT